MNTHSHHACTPRHTHRHKYRQTDRQTDRRHTHTNTHTHAHTHTCTHTHTRTHVHTHKHARTRTRTHTHTHNTKCILRSLIENSETIKQTILHLQQMISLKACTDLSYAYCWSMTSSLSLVLAEMSQVKMILA